MLGSSRTRSRYVLGISPKLGRNGYGPYRNVYRRTFSSAVRIQVETRPLKMIATSRRTWLAWLDTSWAATRSSPPVGARVVVRMEMVVVFGGAART
jgi:hypothetical protein